jgi:hypothetical protein
VRDSALVLAFGFLGTLALTAVAAAVSLSYECGDHGHCPRQLWQPLTVGAALLALGLMVAAAVCAATSRRRISATILRAAVFVDSLWILADGAGRLSEHGDSRLEVLFSAQPLAAWVWVPLAAMLAAVLPGRSAFVVSAAGCVVAALAGFGTPPIWSMGAVALLLVAAVLRLLRAATTD